MIAVNGDPANNCRMKSNSKTSSLYVHMSVVNEILKDKLKLRNYNKPDEMIAQ